MANSSSYELEHQHYLQRYERCRGRNKFYLLSDSKTPRSADFYFTTYDIEHDLMPEQRALDLLRKLFGDDHPRLPQRTITRYLASFCILLRIGEPQQINEFSKHEELSDINLPLCTKPPCLSDAKWTDFQSEQRHFCPWVFRGDYTLPRSQHILPFSAVQEVSKQGSTAQVFKVEIPIEYAKLYSQRSRSLQHARIDDVLQSSNGCNSERVKEFAVKRFTESREHYENECHIFQLIRSRAQHNYPKGLIEFYGCVESPDGNEQLILLELAKGGSLRDLFTNQKPPSTGADIIEFWERLFEPLQGLAKLHELKAKAEAGIHGIADTQWVHQDVHPGNIVLVKRPDSEEQQEYSLRYSYVLSDLGHASTAQSKGLPGDPEHKNTRANAEYVAPEAYSADDFINNTLSQPVSSAVDIYSYGATCLDAATWLVKGKGAVAEFAERRAAEIRSRQDRASRRFHTASGSRSELLDCVKGYLLRSELRSNIKAQDKITAQVLHVLLTPMMDMDPTRRPRVTEIMVRAAELIEKAKAELQHSPSEDSSSSASSHRSVVQHASFDSSSSEERKYVSQNKRRQSDKRKRTKTGFTEREDVSLDDGQVLTMQLVLRKYDNRHHRWRSSFQRMFGFDWSGLPQREWLLRLRKRDFCFIIDNSKSMNEHVCSLEDTFTSMCHVVQQGDNDGVELSFTQSDISMQSSNTHALRKAIQRCKYAGRTAMAKQLGSVLDSCQQRLLKDRRFRSSNCASRGINIYVLTDGKWHDPDQVKKLIQTNAKWMEDNMFGRTDLNISFISFADPNDVGDRHMRALDDLKVPVDVAQDVVDCEHHYGSFLKMILGGLCRDLDKGQLP